LLIILSHKVTDKKIRYVVGVNSKNRFYYVDLLVQKEELDLRIVNLEADAERSYNQVKTDANTALFDLLCV